MVERANKPKSEVTLKTAIKSVVGGVKRSFTSYLDGQQRRIHKDVSNILQPLVNDPIQANVDQMADDLWEYYTKHNLQDNPPSLFSIHLPKPITSPVNHDLLPKHPRFLDIVRGNCEQRNKVVAYRWAAIIGVAPAVMLGSLLTGDPNVWTTATITVASSIGFIAPTSLAALGYIELRRDRKISQQLHS